MPNKTLTIEKVLDILDGTPRRIDQLTAGLPPSLLRTAPAGGEWSANDVLAHLRACADVRGGALLRIIAEDRPTIRAVDPRSYLTQTDHLDLEFQTSIAAFAAQRQELMAALHRLPRDDWLRMATVTGAGAVLERTVLFYGQWLAGHERAHVKQIGRIVNAIRP